MARRHFEINPLASPPNKNNSPNLKKKKKKNTNFASEVSLLG
jgi:hypothetical protein